MNENTINAACPFCQLVQQDKQGRIVAQDDGAILIRDNFPVSSGHSLIIPKRHIGSFFESTADERHSMLKLLDIAKEGIDGDYKPDGYNIGINDGPAAGQTVPHLHIHLIPRYAGDVDEPRGGVRWVIPDKAKYWDEDRMSNS